MTEFNPNCGKCGMLNSRGFCSLTACRYPSNTIVVEPKVIRGMMVNPQIEKPQTNADRFRSMSDAELAEWYGTHACCMAEPLVCRKPGGSCRKCWLDWLKQGVDE